MDEVKVLTVQEIRDRAKPIIKTIADKYKGTDFYLDEELATRIINFISLLKHTGGALGGVNFQLLPFQVEFTIETLAVLRKKNGYRKHTTSILFLPRKSGKTELIAALNVWMLFGDKEKQKENYIIASETQQATILYMAMVAMIKQAPTLLNKVDIWKSTKTIEKNNSDFRDIFKVLSSNFSSKDGYKSSLLSCDEPHSYPDSSLYDVMTESMAHREQPLTILLSTAGYNQQGFFKRLLDYAVQVKEGTIKNDNMYLMYFGMKEGEDWEDEQTWIRCNPALGYGVKMDYLRDKYLKAQHSGEEYVSFLTKHLNVWTNSAVTWIKQEDWNASYKYDINEDDLQHEECYAGLDLASTTDIAAFVLIFDRGTHTDVICRFFIPEDNMRERSRNDKVPYETWARDGYIITTPGNVIDYDYIEAQIKKDCEKFNVKEIAYDKWNSSQLVTNLDNEGISQMIAIPQGYGLGNGLREIETLTLGKKLNHGNNPVLKWMVSNVVIQKNLDDKIKIAKDKCTEKIDGVASLSMALAIKMISQPEEEKAIPNIRSF